MKYFTRTFAWMAVGTIAFLAQGHPGFRLDPTDDFSFLLDRSEAAPVNLSIMPSAEIEKILADHLDLFPRSKVPALARHLQDLCARYQFDPAFILSVMQVESGFRVKITSPAGAIGLMQLMPATAEHIANKQKLPFKGARSLHDPFTNLTLGVAYLAYLRDKYRGDSPYFPIAAYNLGPAKLNQLRAQKGFQPSSTKRYYEKIRAGVPKLRFYRAALQERGIAGV